MFPLNVLAVNEIDDIIDKYFLIPKPKKKEKGILIIAWRWGSREVTKRIKTR